MAKSESCTVTTPSTMKMTSIAMHHEQVRHQDSASASVQVPAEAFVNAREPRCNP